MKRRDFVTKMAVGAVAAGPLMGMTTDATARRTSRYAFKLNYAPHFGMFKHHAGEDLIDQITFAAEQGFRAWEDNGMKGRSTDTQEKIAAEMARRGMQMGVFVAHKIYWQEPNLAGGDADLREEFLADIRSSVEVARRVNATWMTVVPGHVDLRVERRWSFLRAGS